MENEMTMKKKKTTKAKQQTRIWIECPFPGETNNNKKKKTQSSSVSVGTRRSDCFTFCPREKNGRQGDIPTWELDGILLGDKGKKEDEEERKEKRVAEKYPMVYSHPGSVGALRCWLVLLLVEQDPADVAPWTNVTQRAQEKFIFLFFPSICFLCVPFSFWMSNFYEPCARHV